MAWNEPGNSGDDNKDPWGKRRDQQGPPDLEDIIKNLQKKVVGIFGGRGGGGGGGRSSGGGLGGRSLMLILFAVFAIWAVSGIYIVDEANRGVILQFGKFYTTTQPGPHWYPRFIQTVYIVETDRSRSIQIGMTNDEALMLTKDENIVDVKFEVQYKVKDAKNYLFNVRDPENTLKQATESALREVVGKNEMDYVLTTGRDDVASQTGKLIQDILDRYNTGLLVIEVNLAYSDAPEEVKPAFNDVNSAEQDQERYIREAEKYQNQILPIARGEAARVIQEATAYRAEVIAKSQGDAQRFVSVLYEYKRAPRVTRERLYIEAIESVFANTSKIMIDVKKGNSLLYLPIDKLQSRASSSMRRQADLDQTDSLPGLDSETSRDRDDPRSRERGTR